MWLIAGLGNPGSQYDGHRHNIGFHLADELAYFYGFYSWSKKFSAQVSSWRIGDAAVTLIKPQTFMNRSGQSVGEACRFYKIEPENVLVIHDELDIALGEVRVKQGGGHGGHNGLRDVDRHIGKDYWRIRFGIDHPGHKDQVSDYVLSSFAKAEQGEVEQRVDDVVRALPVFFKEGASAFKDALK